MRGAAWLAWRDLAGQRWQAAALAAVFSIAIMAFVALASYQAALDREYPAPAGDFLVIQETQSFAEFYGSRLSPATIDRLAGGVMELAVPEIHSVVGTSLQDAVLLKGIDLAGYSELDEFSLFSGRALAPGDEGRSVMLGVRLAERLGAGPGDRVNLRGRPFEVVGIFETGTYAENEAWVPLAGAQELLGWGRDVSLYVIPDDGRAQAGQTLAPGVSVVRRGELWSTFPRQWQSLLSLLRVVADAIGLAAAFSLAVMLWRLAWQRRWQMGVMRTVGFGRGAYLAYLGVQGATITLLGGLAGSLLAVGLVRFVRVNLAGVSLRPEPPADLFLATCAWVVLLTGLSVVVPAWQLGRRRVGDLLKTQ